MLRPTGATLTVKTFWWSREFAHEPGFPGLKEPQPLIKVTGRRLDAPGSFSAGIPGTHALADFGTAMLVGIEIPAIGCWEVRARYKGAEVAYVALVEQ